jgi:hypothetical protein
VGTPLAAIRLLNTCDNLVFDGLHISGTETAALDSAVVFQHGIACNSGQTISRVRVVRCTFNNLNAGVAFNANLSGSYIDSSVSLSHFKNIVGGGGGDDLSGQGYAIHMAGTLGSGVYDNAIDNAGRHSIYIANDDGAVISGNRIVNHRAAGSTAVIRPAIACYRSENVLIEGNSIRTFKDGAIAISKQTADSADCRNVVVRGNSIINPQNAVPPVSIGEADTDVSDETANILIADNTVEIDGADTTLGEWLRLTNGFNITIRNNHVWAHDMAASSHDLMRIGDATNSLTTNTGQLRIENNLARITDSTGASVRLMRLMDCPIFESNMDVAILNNGYSEDGTASSVVHEYFVGGVTTVDNTQLVMREWNRARPSVASTAALLIPPNSDSILVSGTADITSIGVGYIGRVVHIVFSGNAATNGVVDGSNLKLAGNFGYTTDDHLSLVSDGTNWRELSRSVN